MFRTHRDLERHCKTCHVDSAGSINKYICRYPGCTRELERSFSRRDNARQHVVDVHKVHRSHVNAHIEEIQGDSQHESLNTRNNNISDIEHVVADTPGGWKSWHQSNEEDMGQFGIMTVEELDKEMSNFLKMQHRNSIEEAGPPQSNSREQQWPSSPIAELRPLSATRHFSEPRLPGSHPPQHNGSSRSQK
ncbi:hypothetical protein ABW21_db0200081 [Orbilia brochopaga]|nr:hypothetical protein ABW21_db0200081 [Drechslerella brochopaga]